MRLHELQLCLAQLVVLQFQFNLMRLQFVNESRAIDIGKLDRTASRRSREGFGFLPQLSQMFGLHFAPCTERK